MPTEPSTPGVSFSVLRCTGPGFGIGSAHLRCAPPDLTLRHQRGSPSRSELRVFVWLILRHWYLLILKKVSKGGLPTIMSQY